MSFNVTDIKRQLQDFFQSVIKNIVSLGNDSTLETDLKPLKIGGKNTQIELSENEVHIKGTLNYNGSEVITEAGDVDSLNDLSDVTYEDGDLTIAGLDKIISGSIVSDSSGDITLDAHGGDIYLLKSGNNFGHIDMTSVGVFKIKGTTNYKVELISQGTGDINLTSADDITIDATDALTIDTDGTYIMKKDGTEFSAANSAYAGMILGYTDIGLDEAVASYNLTTSYAVPTSEFNVVFVAPPSGNVEIFIQIQFDSGSSGQGDLYAGLSDNATYNTIEDITEEELIDQSGRFGLDTVLHSWTRTGLTAGTSYTWYAGFKSSSTGGTPHIQWGGDATNLSPDFIMKATALPATIAT